MSTMEQLQAEAVIYSRFNLDFNIRWGFKCPMLLPTANLANLESEGIDEEIERPSEFTNIFLLQKLTKLWL